EHARKLNAASLERDEAEEIPAGHALVIQFALDGYALNTGVGTGGVQLTPKLKAAFRDTLMALAQPEAGPTPQHRRKNPRPPRRRPSPAPPRGPPRSRSTPGSATRRRSTASPSPTASPRG